MNEKRGGIDGLSIKPTKDDVESYRRSQGRNGRLDTPRQSSFNGTLVFVMVLMAIVMGVGGYTLYEVQKKLDRATDLLAKGEENVSELELRLNATGSDVSKTLIDINDQMARNGDEIRKLWDVSNKRNKKWIQTNQKLLDKNSRQLAAITKGFGQVEQKMTSVVSSLDSSQREREDFQRNLSADMEDLITSVTLFRGQLQDQADEVQRNSRQLATLNSKQKGVDEAIHAIDQHRRILNQQLAELQNQLRLLHPNSGGTLSGL